MRYGIGLDIGIASVGFAALALNDLDEPCGVIRMGVRVFDTAEHPKDGSSLAAPRRIARSMRRRLRRHRHRLERIRAMIVKYGILTQKELEGLYDKKCLEDIYALRVRALDAPLSNEEFARILIHLAQRRGFRSNRKADSGDKEQGKLLKAVDENRRRMEAGGYRTAGEMFFKDDSFSDHKRNKSEEYLSTVSRDLVAEEAGIIFQRQRDFHQPFAAAELQSAYLGILLAQRSFDEGPGGGSPYGGNQVERMRGKCLFEKEENRAAKASYSFELFRLLQKTNHLRLTEDGKARPLTESEWQAVVRLAHKTESSKMTYAAVRKALKLEDSVHFIGVDYRRDAKKDPESARYESLPAYHAIRKALDKVRKGLVEEKAVDTLDAIGEILTLYKQEESVRAKLLETGLSEQEAEALLSVTPFSGFGHLSLKALGKIIPFLREGMTYDAACEQAGYDFRSHDAKPQMFLPSVSEEMEQITSPVVRRSVAQTIKVVNALIREMGESPVYVHIELAREMSRDFTERRDMMRQMQDNAEHNEEIMQQLRQEMHVQNPTGLDLVKLKLYHQQQGRCAYSLEAIDLNRLFEKGYAEVDHIIPYSVSFNDSYNNKALALSKENREKRNRLPLQYLTGEKRERFIVHTMTALYPARKRDNLLKERVTKEDEERFKERNLQDTKHMSRFLYNYINDHLLFAKSAVGRKKRVTSVNGAITAHMRKRWGLTKLREEGDLHHALDAAVIACTTDGMIQQVSRFYAAEGNEYTLSVDGASSVHLSTGEVFPLPWPGFREDVSFRMGKDPAERLTNLRARKALPSYDALPRELIENAKPIVVSRMPRRKVTGAAHMETVKGLSSSADGEVLKRIPLTALKLDSDGEIEGYWNPQDDRLLYEMLRQKLKDAGGDAKKAFKEPVFKPDKSGNPRQPVRKVKVTERNTLNVPVHDGTGVADNGSMVRIDVFNVENDGFYFVPVYVSDTIRPELPDKACVAHKPNGEWKQMEGKDFRFSLYPNDAIRIKARDGVKLTVTREESKLPKERMVEENELLYYKGANISSGKIEGCTHDNAYIFGKGIKRLADIEKYQVDVLGNTSRVSRERRLPFRKKG